ncbi:MAG TPA: hypothetical protein VEP66_00195 [Myxococcales bacterium]|nr:hypothetical protein [Myxococcales bacterium]
MIAPGLLRRSLRQSLRWRVLAIWWLLLLVPSAIAAMPAFALLRAQLDHSPASAGSVAWMDGATLLDLVHQLVSSSASSQALLAGWIGALLVLLLTAPFAAAAMVAAAGAGEPLPFPRLLAAAGGLYGRMLRAALAGLVPLGLAAALAGLLTRVALQINENVDTETAAHRNLWLATTAAAALLFVAHVIADTARAQFAADPSRRSALGALVAAGRLLARRPFRCIAVGAVGAAVGLGGASAAMAVRLQIAQSGPAAVALAWLLAQAAATAVGWGRAARIEGLAELSRTEAAWRARREVPPGSGPVPATEVVRSETLSALEPPRSGAPR